MSDESVKYKETTYSHAGKMKEMLLELNFPLGFSYKTHWTSGYADNPDDVPAPTKEYEEADYFKVKKWLWDKHMIRLATEEGMVGHYSKVIFPDNQTAVTRDFGSPIESEIEGIHMAVWHMLLKNKLNNE